MRWQYEEYKPPYTLTEEMMNLVSSISEKIGKINVYYNIDSKPHLRKNNRIKSIHSSLKIEANSLSIGGVRDVIDGRVVFGEQREIQEVKNAYNAYGMMNTVNSYDLQDLKKVHSIMVKMLEIDASCFRKGDEGVFNGEQCIFMAPPANLVPKLMSDLFLWMNKNKIKVHPLILSAIFHYEFVFIHPFFRWKLWHTAILSKWNSVFEYIPIESQIQKFQDGYYKVIANCHIDGESNVFKEFMLNKLIQF